MPYALGLEKKPWEGWLRDNWWWWWRWLVIHNNQNGVGEGGLRRWSTTITTNTGRAGIRAYWGCILIMSGDDWNDATNYILWDGMKFDGRQLKATATRTHTTTNQKHTAIMEDVRRGGTIIRDVKGRRLVTIVGSSGNICWAGERGEETTCMYIIIEV